MEKLFRLGHEPALTMGNAKSIDILVHSNDGSLRDISVKAVCGGGKWGVSADDESACKHRIYVLLLYRDFDNVNGPSTWVASREASSSPRPPMCRGQRC